METPHVVQPETENESPSPPHPIGYHTASASDTAKRYTEAFNPGHHESPRESQVSDSAVRNRQMKRISSVTDRINRTVFRPFRNMTNSSFGKSLPGNKLFKSGRKTVNSYASSHFSSECDEEALREASNELDSLIRERESLRKLYVASENYALVTVGQRERGDMNSDSRESADEEIDISGYYVPPPPKIRTWEVRNLRMERQTLPTKGEKKKSIFQKMSSRL